MQNNNQTNAHFVSVKIENFLERADIVYIKINFLGSCHSAAKHPGAGEPYGSSQNVYYNCILQGSNHNLTLTFSGPTKFDIKKPNIKSITEEAKNILSDLIPNISLLKKNIVINILGHSRGGVVANTIHKWLSSIDLGKSVQLGRLSVADPYAGPINRRINNEHDNFDNSDSSNEPLNIPTKKLAVYTVAEKRFRDPAQSLKSDTLVFTDTSHDKTQFIAEYVFNNLNKYNDKLYICADPNNELKKIYTVVNRRPTGAEQKYIDLWLERHIEPDDEKNIDNILNGKGIYKNFSFQKISSDGRRELLYTAFSKLDNGKNKEQVKEYLEKNAHSKSMWKKVEKHLS